MKSIFLSKVSITQNINFSNIMAQCWDKNNRIYQFLYAWLIEIRISSLFSSYTEFYNFQLKTRFFFFLIPSKVQLKVKIDPWIVKRREINFRGWFEVESTYKCGFWMIEGHSTGPRKRVSVFISYSHKRVSEWFRI